MDDLIKLDKLYTHCVLDLNSRGIHQWDSSYPNMDTYRTSIKSRSQYIFEDNELIIGAVILNGIQAEEWSAVPWNYNDEKILIVHALVINPLFQGKGNGQKVLELCEQYAMNNGFVAIRLDVFSENPYAIKLYERNLFQKVGEVTFYFKPEGHQQYYCYEKNLLNYSRNQERKELH